LPIHLSRITSEDAKSDKGRFETAPVLSFIDAALT
jgi:hypothetical protein